MEPYAPKIKLSKRGKPGAFYLLVPKDLVETMGLKEGSEARILIDKQKKSICYNFA
jgi:hypothetical protein